MAAEEREPETFNIKGTIIWNDGDDQDKLRPSTLTLRLLDNNDVEIANKELSSADEMEGNWEFSWDALPCTDDYYSIIIPEVDGYTNTEPPLLHPKYGGDYYWVITYSHIPATVPVE